MDPLEDVAAEFGDTPGLFQLYTPTDRDLAESFVHRAEAAGTPASWSPWTPGYRAGDRAIWPPRTSRSCVASAWPTTSATRTSAPRSTADIDADPRNAVMHWISVFGNSLTWNDLPWLRSLTKLPLILKGHLPP